MRHETQSEDASLEENSKRLKWQNFSVPDTAAKRGLSLGGALFFYDCLGRVSFCWRGEESCEVFALGALRTFTRGLKRPKKDAEHISTSPGAGISLFNFLKEVANMSLIFLSLCFFNEALLIIPLNIEK